MTLSILNLVSINYKWNILYYISLNQSSLISAETPIEHISRIVVPFKMFNVKYWQILYIQSTHHPLAWWQFKTYFDQVPLSVQYSPLLKQTCMTGVIGVDTFVPFLHHQFTWSSISIKYWKIVCRSENAPGYYLYLTVT